VGTLQTESILKAPEHTLLQLLYGELRLMKSIEAERLPTHVALPPKTPWPCKVYLGVKPSDLELKHEFFGDADSVLVPITEPTATTAIEFKRIRITNATFDTGMPGGLQELKKAVRQGNALAQAGFAYVWVTVLVVTDSPERRTPEKKYVPPPGAVMRAVESSIPVDCLNPVVGLYITEITQPVDRPVLEEGVFGGNLIRPARRQQQPDHLTAAIQRLPASLRVL
jgi:hypothetical protein